MLHFSDTRSAGQRAEQEVREILKRYTKHIYSNIRIDTLYTKSGTTEVDLVAAIADILLVIEVKNISAIEGSIVEPFWYLTGLETGQRFSALNVLTQNRIHVRSLKDAWFANRGELPPVLSVVVVPNDCIIPQDIAEGGVLTLQQFSKQIAAISNLERCNYGYVLDYLFRGDNAYLERADFIGGSNA